MGNAHPTGRQIARTRAPIYPVNCKSFTSSSTLVEPFQRGTGRIHDGHAGVGLGLAIVRSITQAHDGTLTLTPREAGGLGVTVRLPLAAQGTH